MKSRLIEINIYLFVLMFLFVLVASIDAFADQHIPNSYEIKSRNEKIGFLTFNDFEDAQIQEASVYKEINSMVNDGLNTKNNTLTVLTNEEFAVNYNLKLIAGSFFNKSMVKNKSAYVVISDLLALEAFLRVEPIGEKVFIENYSYTIIGVYEANNKSFWGSLSEDAYERLYIPYTTYPKHKNIEVDAIALKNNDKLYENINNLTIFNPSAAGNFVKLDYIEKKRCATQFIPILLFVLEAVIVCFLIKLAYGSVKAFVMRIYQNRDRGYLFELLKKDIKKLLIVFVILLACISVVVALFKIMNFPLVISNSVLPNDNLFDIGHYMNKVVEFFTFNNTYNLSGDKFIYMLNIKTIISGIVLSLFIYPIICLFSIRYKELVKKDLVLAVVTAAIVMILVLAVVIIKLCTNSDMIERLLSICFTWMGLVLITLLRAMQDNKYLCWK